VPTLGGLRLSFLNSPEPLLISFVLLFESSFSSLPKVTLHSLDSLDRNFQSGLFPLAHGFHLLFRVNQSSPPRWIFYFVPRTKNFLPPLLMEIMLLLSLFVVRTRPIPSFELRLSIVCFHTPLLAPPSFPLPPPCFEIKYLHPKVDIEQQNPPFSSPFPPF